MSGARPGADEALALVGDIGSTNVRFAMAAVDDSAQGLRSVRTLRCAEHAGLAAAVEAYLSGIGGVRPAIAAIAVAGPVTGDRVSLTNAAWSFSIAAMKAALGLERLTILNDFTAVALSLPRLGGRDVTQIGPGKAVPGEPLAVIGPGTGLGVSALVPSDGGWRPLASEGGHAGFAPATEQEEAIAARLRRRFGRVSWERVLSGPGLVNLYAALAGLGGHEPPEAALPTPAEVTERALAGSCALCREALELFCGLLGAAAGDLALVVGARGGVYLAGGIAPRLAAFLPRSAFRTRFEAKGRLSAYVASIPTLLIATPHAGLLGAAAALLRGPARAG